MSVPFDAEAIRVLAGILTETGLTEIEISDKDYRLRVAKMPATVMASMGGAQPMMAPAAAPVALPEVAVVSDAAHPGAVNSPMVGVAYLSAEPGTPPYVTVGQSVIAGQTLLLIEAMKTFNQIKAPRAGTVTRIVVQAGAPVEFGEPLLIIE